MSHAALSVIFRAAQCGIFRDQSMRESTPRLCPTSRACPSCYAIHGSPAVPVFSANHGCIRIPVFAAAESSKLATIEAVIVYEKSQVSGNQE